MINTESNLKNIQADTQTFKKLIEGNFIYVDKTKHLHDTINKRTACFISRPRRFGKSLTCSTLEQIFLGNKELFKGLWIYNSDYEWKKYPVIKIDMSSISAVIPEEFKFELTQRIFSIAEDLNIDIGERRSPESLFEHIIKKLSKQEKVVIIIDEYDSPILTQITNPSAATDVRETLRSFYKILKSQDANIRFTFVTGVSKFSKTSFFSGANHLSDLTMLPSYADMLGYTQEELEYYFKDYIEISAKNMGQTKREQLAQLKHWYNGYRFSTEETKVYNPFSVLSHFDNVVNSGLRFFENYWFASGTPTFLIELIKNNKYPIHEIDNYETNKEELDTFDIENIDLSTLLFQSGYTTIKSFRIKKNKLYYTLGYSNEETKISMIKKILKSISNRIRSTLVDNTAEKLQEALDANNIEMFIEAFKNVFVRIPYDLHPTGNILDREWFYQSIFFAICDVTGFPITAEEHTSIGRIDAVITTNTHVYIFEFKIDSDAKKALEQIKEKRYYEKYQQDKKEIVLVGINFDTTLRNIKDWIVDEVA